MLQDDRFAGKLGSAARFLFFQVPSPHTHYHRAIEKHVLLNLSLIK
ncbi:hypothetical protein LLB_1346 [Legionella longbeachae D-4968]|nr:hypothetical protein LLB_1346 [Legionella longbeachae D-4968]